MEFKSNPFKLIVKVNSPRTEFLGYDTQKGAYIMNVHAAPEKGKANKEIIKFFKKEFKKNIKIVSGKASKIKLIRLLD
jgi:hypothetical protein